MSFLAAIPLRFWIYAAIAAAASCLFWHDHHETLRANELAAQLLVKDQKLNAAHLEAAAQKESRNVLEQSLTALRRGRADTPVRVVRLCPAAGVSASATARAPQASPDELPDSARRDPQESGSTGLDIGPELYALVDDANEAGARCNAVIRFNLEHPPPD